MAAHQARLGAALSPAILAKRFGLNAGASEALFGRLAAAGLLAPPAAKVGAGRAATDVDRLVGRAETLLEQADDPDVGDTPDGGAPGADTHRTDQP